MFPEIFHNILTHCYCSGAGSSVWGSAGTPCSYSGGDPGTQTEAVGAGGAVDVVDVVVDVVDVVDVDGVGVDDTPHHLQDGVCGRQAYLASLQGT